MTKMIAWILPFVWSTLAFAADVKDAPIPTEMNWTGIIAFAVIFFGLSGGFMFMVWKNAQKKNDKDKPVS
jgi:cytochrome c oxidase subunit IV